MLKFVLQLAVALAGFIAFFFVAGLLEPIFTNPIVFCVVVGFIGLVAIRIAVRG